MCGLFSNLIIDVTNLSILLENLDFLNEINTQRDSFGKNILHAVTHDENVEVLKLLLAKVDRRLLNEKSANGQTPLCFGLTAKSINEEFFLELLSYEECDVNIADKRHLTLLHYAVFHDEQRITRRILDRGVNVDGVSITGITPLYLAVEKNNYEMVCMLLYYDADVNVECEENNPYTIKNITAPILYCIDRGYYDLTELLLDYIADIDEPYSNGLTILYHAIRNESQTTYQLIERGANINYKYHGKHCIMAVTRMSSEHIMQTFFHTLWPLVDLKYMMECCPKDLYELFFKFNLLPDDFFASIFIDNDVEDTICFAKFILLGKANVGTMLKNRDEETLLGLFYSMLQVYDEVSQQVLIQILNVYGYGKLFWTFVYVNVKIEDFFYPIQAELTLSRFLFDLELSSCHSILFWRHHFAMDNMEPDGLCTSKICCIPSLQEIARRVVRQRCRRAHDIELKRVFAFLNRIKNIGLSKVLEDILLLRRAIYVK